MVIGPLTERTAAVEEMVHILEISSSNMDCISKNVQLCINILILWDRILKIRFKSIFILLEERRANRLI